MAEETPSALENQIVQLERDLAQKRAELGMDAAAPIERDEVHAAIGNQIKQAVPTYQAPAVPSAQNVPSWQDPALAAQIQELVNIAFTQSLQDAIAQAVKTGNPALLDALHDVLVDQLHQELLNRQKLQPTP